MYYSFVHVNKVKSKFSPIIFYYTNVIIIIVIIISIQCILFVWRLHIFWYKVDVCATSPQNLL